MLELFFPPSPYINPEMRGHWNAAVADLVNRRAWSAVSDIFLERVLCGAALLRKVEDQIARDGPINPETGEPHPLAEFARSYPETVAELARMLGVCPAIWSCLPASVRACLSEE